VAEAVGQPSSQVAGWFMGWMTLKELVTDAELLVAASILGHE
jgi:hypothetical protein